MDRDAVDLGNHGKQGGDSGDVGPIVGKGFHRLGEGTSQIQQLIIGRELFK